MITGMIKNTDATWRRHTAYCLAGVLASVIGLFAINPLIPATQLQPLDHVYAGEGDIDSSAPSPMKPGLFSFSSKPGAQSSNYMFFVKARIDSADASCKLLDINPGGNGMSLQSLPGGAISVVEHHDAESRELLVLQNAFRPGEWFSVGLNKAWYDDIVLNGSKNTVVTLAPHAPREINAFSAGDGSCSIAGVRVEYKSLGYGQFGDMRGMRNFCLFAETFWWLLLLVSLSAALAQLLFLLSGTTCTSPHERIEITAFILLGGFFCAVVFHYIAGKYLGLPYPESTFLFNPAMFLSDLFNPVQSVAAGLPYLVHAAPEPGVYFPLVYWFLYPASRLGRETAGGCFIVSISAVFVWLNARCLRRAGMSGSALWRNVLIFSLLSYPLLFCLDRGNIEACVFFAVTAAVYLLENGMAMAGALALSLAIAAKGYPGLFLLLFLKRGEWRAASVSCAVSAALVLVPLAVAHGGFLANLDGMRLGMQYFFHAYALENNAYDHNASLFNLLRMGSYVFYGWQDRALLLEFFNFAGFLCVCGVAYYIWRREYNLWKQTALLVCTMILFTPVSNDYKMLALFLPLWLFITAAQREGASRLNTAYIVLLGLLLIPKEYPLPGCAIAPHMALGVLLNPLLMLALCVLIIVEGIWLRAAADMDMNHE
jgi:hypothetical protein